MRRKFILSTPYGERGRRLGGGGFEEEAVVRVLLERRRTTLRRESSRLTDYLPTVLESNKTNTWVSNGVRER